MYIIIIFVITFDWKLMRSIGITIWLVFGAMLLGWYGLAIAFGGAAIYVIGYLIKCYFDGRRDLKRRKERGL